MLQPSKDTYKRDAVTHLAFFNKDEEKIARFVEKDSVPIPEEGDNVRLGHGEQTTDKFQEKPNIEFEDIGTYEVDRVNYDYTLTSYFDEDDEEVEQLFCYVNIIVEELEEEELDEEEDD